ncbi:MAG: TusE/DsrC/DsvC family sulfur relay protein [Gammaproteobacteria bacterium]
MAIEVDGKTIETTDNGYLVNIEDWSKEVAQVMADADEVVMSEKHWDIVEFLRNEHFDNGGNEPNERTITKEMGKKWGTKTNSKEMYGYFPGMPSKQGRKIAGLPQSTRKGGY